LFKQRLQCWPRLLNLARSYAGTRMLAGTGWSVAGSGAARALTVATALIAARILGRDAFGAFSLVQLTIATAATVAGLQMGSTATRYVAEYRHTAPAQSLSVIRLVTHGAVFTGMCAATALLLMAEWLSTATLRQPSLATLIRLSAPGAFLAVLTGVQSGILIGLEEFRGLAAVSLAGGISIVAGVLLGSVSRGLAGATLGWVIGTAIQWAVGWYRVRKAKAQLGCPLRLPPSFHRGLLVSYTAPTFLASVVLSAALFRCNTLLLQSHSLSEVGLYAAADRFRLMLLFVPGAILSTMFPILANLRGGRDSAAFAQVLRQSAWLIVVVLGLPAVVTAVCATRLLAATFGGTFSAAAPTLIILCAASVLEAANIMLGYVLNVGGRVWLRSCIDMGLGGLLLLLGTRWIPRFGSIGFAGAYAMSFALAVAALAAALAWLRSELSVPSFSSKASNSLVAAPVQPRLAAEQGK
jgi:O-antigen/teichoic acid export membrane protein